MHPFEDILLNGDAFPGAKSSRGGQTVKCRCIPSSEVIPDRAVCKFKMTSSENLHIAKRNGRWTAQNAKTRKEENPAGNQAKKNPAFSGP